MRMENKSKEMEEIRRNGGQNESERKMINEKESEPEIIKKK
jgi:hypothetical protein